MGPLRDHNAKVYGIQRDSILNTSNFFHVAEGLVPDIMHDILEGCAQYEVKELLKHLHQDNVVTLEYVNDQIKTFPYSTPDSKNKPSAISGTTFKSPDHSVKQKGPYLSYSIEYIYLSITCFFFSAAQMWCLCRLLPLMIGEKIPESDRRWKNFLVLLDIIDIVFSPLMSEDHISYLHLLIEEHHHAFKELYPSCTITPKLHYMVHYPQWMSRYHGLLYLYMYLHVFFL